MYPYIVCFCGRSLGDIYDLFMAMKAAKRSDAYSKGGLEVDPNLLPISEDVQVDLVDVFDELNMDKDVDCCRVRLMTQVQFKEMY